MEPTKPTSDPMSPQPAVPNPNIPQMPNQPIAPAASPVASAGIGSGPGAVSDPAPNALTPQSVGYGAGSFPVPVVGSADMPPTVPGVVPTASAARGGKRWLLPVILGSAAVLVVGVSYVFAFYLPNTPDAIYKTSLKNTGRAVDVLVGYSEGVSNKKYKSYDFNGTIRAKSSDISFDATLKGSLDEQANATATLDANVLGQKMSVDVRSKKQGGNTSPDIYVRLTGAKSMLTTYSLANLDNQWIGIDHTLIDTAVASASEVQLAQAASTPTTQQTTDAIAKVQVVNREYLFTADDSKAVFKKFSYVGKETKEGREAHHYRVSYDKTHMLAYVTAVGAALDSSKLNDWSKSANDGQKLSKVMDLDELKNDIRGAKQGYTFDMWVDAKTKLVRALSFTDPADINSEFVLTQNYTGGDSYPFALALTTKDPDTKVASKTTVKLTVNTKTDKVNGDLVYEEDARSTSFTFAVTPSAKAVSVTAPTGAIPAMDLVNQLGLGGLL